MILAALTVLFFRTWFSYTIYQWFMEFKETDNRVRDHGSRPEIERQVARRLGNQRDVEAIVNRNRPVVGEVVNQNADYILGAPPVECHVGEPVLDSSRAQDQPVGYAMPVHEVMAYPDLSNNNVEMAQLPLPLPNPDIASVPVSPNKPLNARV